MFEENEDVCNDFRSLNFTSEINFFNEIVRVASSPEACFEVVDILTERFRCGICSLKSQGFTFYEPFSDP